MSRTSGCPFNIRDYSVKVKDPVTSVFQRVKGLNAMRVELEAETEDGRTGAALWSEAFVKSRGISGSLEGRPIADRATGARDPGQALLHAAAMCDGGCDNDQTLRVADAIGRAVEYDCVVTRESTGADGDGETVSWEWKGVGSPRPIAYVQAASVGFSDGTQALTGLSMAPGDVETVCVAFTPEDASNQRFCFSMADEGVAVVTAAEDLALNVRAVATGSTTLTVRSMNNARTAALPIVVSGT